MDVSMEDVRHGDYQDSNSTLGDDRPSLPLSEKEQRILDLYDRLLQLELELALTKARQETTIDTSQHITPEQVREAQDGLLEAKASWALRNEVVESVMMVNPIVKAVHRATDSSPIERDLLPYVEQRDEISIAITKQDTDIQKINDELRDVQVEALKVGKRNAELAAEVLSLAAAADQSKSEFLDDAETQEEMRKLERELKTSRQKWKVMKGTASAVVAGSGVDWVKDAELRDIVLDPD